MAYSQPARAQDADLDQSVVAVRAGEPLTERQLLEALLIPSGNNIARLLANVVAGQGRDTSAILAAAGDAATRLVESAAPAIPRSTVGSSGPAGAPMGVAG